MYAFLKDKIKVKKTSKQKSLAEEIDQQGDKQSRKCINGIFAMIRLLQKLLMKILCYNNKDKHTYSYTKKNHNYD